MVEIKVALIVPLSTFICDLNRNVFQKETKPGGQEVHPSQDPVRGRLGLFASSNHYH